jgi:hypothetical protein
MGLGLSALCGVIKGGTKEGSEQEAEGVSEDAFKGSDMMQGSIMKMNNL